MKKVCLVLSLLITITITMNAFAQAEMGEEAAEGIANKGDEIADEVENLIDLAKKGCIEELPLYVISETEPTILEEEDVKAEAIIDHETVCLMVINDYFNGEPEVPEAPCNCVEYCSYANSMEMNDKILCKMFEEECATIDDLPSAVEGVASIGDQISAEEAAQKQRENAKLDAEKRALSEKEYSDLKIKSVRGVGKIAKPDVDHETMCTAAMDLYFDDELEVSEVPCNCLEYCEGGPGFFAEKLCIGLSAKCSVASTGIAIKEKEAAQLDAEKRAVENYGRIGNLPGEYSKKKYSDLKIKGVRGVGKIAKPNIDHEAMCVVILDHYLDGDIEAEGVPCSCVEHYSNLSDLTIRENIKLLQHLMQCPMKGPPNL